MPPDVTVVVPTRDRWPLLRRALRSALGQLETDVEVVVVDDGSADETPARLAELGDPRVRVLRHESSEGVARARNDGIAAARGTWVAFLDDDDLWSPRKLRASLDAAAAAGGGWAYGAAVIAGPDLVVRRPQHPPPPAQVVESLLVTNRLGGPSNVMARTELVRELGGFDETLSTFADWDLWIRLARAGPPAASEEVLVAFVQHGENMLAVGGDDVLPEFERLAAKHEAACRAAGVEFGSLWLMSWRALAHREAGRRVPAAGVYVRDAVRNRSRRSAVRAAGALLGERTMGWGQRRARGGLPSLPWLQEARREAAADRLRVAAPLDPGTPRVAVITPCFNDGDTLEEALASLREDEPLEVVVVDDASTDPATRAALDRVAARGHVVVRQKRNVGVGEARLAGLRASSAPYVLPLDADDLAMPGVIGRMADVLDAHPEVAVVFGDYEEFGDGEALRQVPSQLDPYRLAYAAEFGLSALFRRAALEDAGAWAADGIAGYEDWHIWMALAERGHRGVHLGEGVITYRRRMRQGRMLASARREHGRRYARLRELHPSLFADLPAHRQASDLSAVRKLVFPLLYGRRPRFGFERRLRIWLNRRRLWLPR